MRVDIRNRLYWCINEEFREDGYRVRQGYASESFAMICGAMNLLKQERILAAGINAKRRCADWGNAYLLKFLSP